MTDATLRISPAHAPRARGSLLVQDERTRKRNAAEARFKAYGLIAIGIGLLMLVILWSTTSCRAAPARFQQTFVTLEVELPADKLDKNGNRDIGRDQESIDLWICAADAHAFEPKAAEENGMKPTLKPKDMAGILSNGRTGAACAISCSPIPT